MLYYWYFLRKISRLKKLDQNMLPIKVEMHTRIKLAEVLLKETDNIAMAEDLLSKGVNIPILRIIKLMTDSAYS